MVLNSLKLIRYYMNESTFVSLRYLYRVFLLMLFCYCLVKIIKIYLNR